MTAGRGRTGKPIRVALGAAALACGLLVAAPAAAQPGGPAGSCTRPELQERVKDYIAAQTAGDTALLKFGGEWIQYNEQLELDSLGTGTISKPLKIDFHRSLYDPVSCTTFTELVVTDPAHPYVIGTLLTGRQGTKISGLDLVVTDKDDWLFNAANTLKYAKAEKWDEIPEARRDTRETLLAAANAYLDSFGDKTVQVPWGQPCARLEGGLYTAKGAPGVVSAEDSCNVGVPSDVKLVDRRYVVDPVLGAVAVMLSFGTNALPDVHTFRIEQGKIRYVHTITACKTPNCGFPLPKELGGTGTLPSVGG